MRILICQLGVYGDALYASTIAQQIKHDDPGGTLDWVIGSKYKDILNLNPDVDNVITYPVETRLDVKKKWFDFVKHVNENLAGQYDEVYFTQAYPGNPDLFYGSLRASMFRVYPHPITVPLNPVIILSNEEVERVTAFANHHRLSDYKHVILFECSPQSGQSSLTEEGAVEIATDIAAHPGDCVVMSGNSAKISYLISKTGSKNIIDASTLTFRENAELTKYCTLLLGTGSGITQICQSTWAKHLPTIQILDRHTVASLISDHEYFGLPTDDILEVNDATPDRISSLVSTISYFGDSGVKRMKEFYAFRVEPDFNIIRFHMRFDTAMITGRPLDIIPALLLTVKDYGLSKGLLYFISTLPGSVKTILKRKSEGVY